LLGERHDVPELLRSSDILLFTARPPEGMPGVLIEAGLSGLPVVSTRVPGAAEVIDDGVTGRLVDVDDITGMVSAVRYLLADDEGRAQMGQWARERCSSLFSFEATADKWEKLFIHLLVNRRRRK
jgi:glycosyltransferase involved in cell wall biosynthesis